MYPCVLDLPLFHSRAEALSLIFRQNPCALYIQTSRPRLFVVINVGFQCKTADGVAIGHHPIGLKFRPIFRREEVFWIRPEYFAVKIAQSSNIVRNNCLPELNCQFGPFCPAACGAANPGCRRLLAGVFAGSAWPSGAA